MAVKWKMTISLRDVFHNEEMTFRQRRDAIVARLFKSPWLEDADDDLQSAVEELADSTCPADFDIVWAAIYDMADHDRVWIETF